MRATENRSNVPTMSVEKACVILGAGASCDVAGEGSLIIEHEFRPPLASELFDISNHPLYWNIMAPYRGARVLTQMLAPLISSGQIDVENALRKYAEHTDSQIREQFKHIPAYLRDLLYRASTQYTSMPSCYVRLVAELLAEHPHDVLFLILNYDNLLETALSQFNPKFQFNNIEDYVPVNQKFMVVKLHGSINWFRHLPGGTSVDWDSAVALFNIFEQIPEGQTIVKDHVQTVMNEVHEGQRLYPILTAPLAGKDPTHKLCPERHLTDAQIFLGNCYKYLIIGTSGLDKDLLELLDSAVPPKSRSLVQFVDIGEGADSTRNRFEEGVRAFRSNRAAPSDITYNDGFREYLSSKQFRVFVEYD